MTCSSGRTVDVVSPPAPAAGTAKSGASRTGALEGDSPMKPVTINFSSCRLKYRLGVLHDKNHANI